MENTIKVYAGRRSVCAADDARAPNPFTFYLPEDAHELIALLNRHLPYGIWVCYLGDYSTNIRDVEDGVIVWDKKDNLVILSVKYDNQRKPIIAECAEDWYELIKAHPFLYFE